MTPDDGGVKWTKPQAVTTDQNIAKAYGEWYGALMNVHRLKSSKKDLEQRKRQGWNYNGLDTIDARIAEAQKDADALRAKYDTANKQYRGWPRAFLVVNNGQGHVHKSTSCSTCYPTTEFNWMTEYSGDSEDAIVQAAGERACTVCYPSAPVDVLSRPSKMFSDDEKQKQAARDERAVAKSEKDKKRIANAATVDGSELVVPTGSRFPERFKTEMAATQWYTERHAWFDANPSVALPTQALEMIEASLAKKHGISVEAMRARLMEKANAKIAKWRKEAAAWKR